MRVQPSHNETKAIIPSSELFPVGLLIYVASQQNMCTAISEEQNTQFITKEIERREWEKSIILLKTRSMAFCLMI